MSSNNSGGENGKSAPENLSPSANNEAAADNQSADNGNAPQRNLEISPRGWMDQLLDDWYPFSDDDNDDDDDDNKENIPPGFSKIYRSGQ